LRERESRPSKRKRKIFKSPAKKLKHSNIDLDEDDDEEVRVSTTNKRLLTRASYRNSLNSNDIISMSSLEQIKNSARKSLENIKKK
jgi:hypothetical protein